MSEFKLNFKLQQQTPILHFQHDHDGATLRPTEVKAKLDKYIWKKEWGNDFAKGSLFLVGYSPGKLNELKKKFEEDQFRALDYKIQFQARDRLENLVPQTPLYFGNIGADGEDKKEKKLVQSKEVVGSIVSNDPDLIAIIKSYLPAFFHSENFGTRQNKGFGSFKLTSLNGQEVNLMAPSPYFFKVNGTETSILWDHIDLFYRSLRSGINLKGGGQSDKLYFKSLLFQYAKTQGHQWDKRKIRRDLFENHPKFRGIEDNRQDPEGSVQYNKGVPMLYRDMLGLSSEQSWLSYNAKVTKKAVNGEVDRYKSPITFKPFQHGNGWIVYIIPHPIPQEMKDAGFEIESGGKKTILITPDFDLKRYLQFAFSYFDEDNTVKDYLGAHSAHKEARILENIYQQLSKQVNL